MAEGPSQGIDIGFEYVKELYTNTDIETKEAQPIFVVHRDTVRSFFHEKIEVLGVKYRLLGYAGIEVSLLAALATASFEDWLWFGGKLIHGLFLAFAIIFGVLVIKDGSTLWRARKSIDVNKLADELGARGSIIRPMPKADSTGARGANNIGVNSAGTSKHER